MFGGAKKGTAIQLSAVVQYQLKILYGVCIAHIHATLRACKYTIYINFESAFYLHVLAKPVMYTVYADSYSIA